MGFREGHYILCSKNTRVRWPPKEIDIRGERVRINAREYVRITFFDRGVGIPANKVSMITKPFFSTKPLGKCTGLGLITTHKIFTEHGGRLTFESVEGEFTRVTIDLPVKGAQKCEDSCN